MPLKIQSQPSIDIPIKKLQDGQLAIVVVDDGTGLKDRLVQRYGKHLVGVGLPWDQGYGDVFETGYVDNMRVRILDDHTTLVVTGNKLKVDDK